MSTRIFKALAAAALMLACGGLAATAAPADGDNGAGSSNAASPFAADSGGVFGGFASSTMQGSLLGTPGLWSAQFAETLGAGQVSAGTYVSRYSRNPGAMVFTDFSGGFTVGLTRWLELSFSTTPARRVRLNSPLELNGNNLNPLSPFSAGALEKGPVDWDLGLTVGLLSQDRGAPFGLAVQAFEHFPYFQDYHDVVAIQGVATGEAQFTESVLIDKWIGANGGDLVANLGYSHTDTANAGGRVYVPFRDEVLYSYGVVFPRQARVQVITELNGDIPFGAGPHVNYFGPTSPLDSNWGVRVNPTDWMGINAGYRLAATTPHANASGFVFGLSFGPPPAHPAAAPPPPPPPPTAACNVTGGAVAPGATVQISTTVSPASLPYTYAWSTTGGRLTPAGNSATLDTGGLAPGMYTITMHVTNATGGSGECQAHVEVREPPRNPPTATCSADPATTLPGGTLTYSANAQSPDRRPLTYSWQISGGRLDRADQATAHFDTTGANPGTYTATVSVSDDRSLTATCNASARVLAPPPPPQAALGNTLNFKANSSRVDNAAKAALDDLALRLQQDPGAHAVIVGYATSTELSGRNVKPLAPAATIKLAEERAVNAKAYLTQEKGIAGDRIEVRQDILSPMKAEVWIVPPGATYSGPGQTFDESAVKATPPAQKPAAAKKTGGGLR